MAFLYVCASGCQEVTQFIYITNTNADKTRLLIESSEAGITPRRCVK